MPRRRTEQPRRRARRDDDLRRRPPTRRGRAIILIVCEGVETEYRYFEAMRKRQGLISVSIEVARSGRQSERLVEQAVDLRQRRAQQPDALPYEEAWCVFDREAANEPADFPAAIKRAEREQLALAISNPCFEYWYLLHYRETNAPFRDADEVYRRCVGTTTCQTIRKTRMSLSAYSNVGSRRLSAPSACMSVTRIVSTIVFRTHPRWFSGLFTV